MKKYFYIFIFFITNISLLSAAISEPYNSIEDLTFDEHGWFSNGNQLDKILRSKKCYKVIEVGSWLGVSTRFIAQRLPNGSKLYAVDNWTGDPKSPVQQNDKRMPYLYQLFLSNVKHAKLTEIIVPIRMQSMEAAKALNVKADLIYIDGAHDTENVYNDVVAWHAHLALGGIMCGDDWARASVQMGVKKAAKELNKTIEGNNNFWRFN